MGFVKVVKNNAYFKRYQVKYKRRRQCKTDYYARKRLVVQDKNKYQTPKYRFVVRFTNKDIVCQVFSSDMDHDHCLAVAYSHELKRYGLNLGLTNYAAAYCTGLLLARRVNSKFNLNYEGNTEDVGADFNVEDDPEGDRPFKVLLDVGLKRTTTGARVFGALKGACDGGLDVPHNDRRFPGSTKDGRDHESNPDKVREYIMGGHVAAYMTQLKEDDEDRYNVQFKRFVDAGIGPDDLEDLYAACHAAIRADPNKARDSMELGRYKTRSEARDVNKVHEKKRYNRIKFTVQQRKDRIRQKLTAKGIEAQTF